VPGCDNLLRRFCGGKQEQVKNKNAAECGRCGGSELDEGDEMRRGEKSHDGIKGGKVAPCMCDGGKKGREAGGRDFGAHQVGQAPVRKLVSLRKGAVEETDDRNAIEFLDRGDSGIKEGGKNVKYSLEWDCGTRDMFQSDTMQDKAGINRG
jgi:hypothetical protein